MKKLILLGLGIAGACVVGLNGMADAASCSTGQLAGVARCTDANSWTGQATHSGTQLTIQLAGGNAVTHPARVSSIARSATNAFIGSDQVLTSVQNPNPSDTRTFGTAIATQDVFVVSNN